MSQIRCWISPLYTSSASCPKASNRFCDLREEYFLVKVHPNAPSKYESLGLLKLAEKVAIDGQTPHIASSDERKIEARVTFIDSRAAVAASCLYLSVFLCA